GHKPGKADGADRPKASLGHEPHRLEGGLGDPPHEEKDRLGEEPDEAQGQGEDPEHQLEWEQQHSDHANKASTKASGSKGARSSMPSPRPTSLTGIPSSCSMARTTPPLAEPSSLVSTTPERVTAPVNSRAW